MCRLKKERLKKLDLQLQDLVVEARGFALLRATTLPQQNWKFDIDGLYYLGGMFDPSTELSRSEIVHATILRSK